jgi:hypothetical protein
MTWCWLPQTARLLPVIIGAVHAVEAITAVASSADKQEAAVRAVHASVGAVEIGVHRDLLDDAAVDEAVRRTIDAYVALQNAIAERHGVAAPPGP